MLPFWALFSHHLSKIIIDHNRSFRSCVHHTFFNTSEAGEQAESPSKIHHRQHIRNKQPWKKRKPPPPSNYGLWNNCCYYLSANTTNVSARQKKMQNYHQCCIIDNQFIHYKLKKEQKNTLSLHIRFNHRSPPLYSLGVEN